MVVLLFYEFPDGPKTGLTGPKRMCVDGRHIRTDVNVADFFTKQLPKKDYQRYRDYLGMEDHSV